MTTSGGGWTIVYASQALDGDVGMVADAQIPGNALNYEAYNTSRALKMAINAVATESLFKRKLDNALLKASAPLYDPMLDTPNSHLHRVVNLTASNGVSAQGAIGYSNYNTPSGGDYGISMYPDAATCNGATVNASTTTPPPTTTSTAAASGSTSTATPAASPTTIRPTTSTPAWAAGPPPRAAPASRAAASSSTPPCA